MMPSKPKSYIYIPLDSGFKMYFSYSSDVYLKSSIKFPIFLFEFSLSYYLCSSSSSVGMVKRC